MILNRGNLKLWHARLFALVYFNSSMCFGLWLASWLADSDWIVIGTAAFVSSILFAVAMPVGSLMIVLGRLDFLNPLIERKHAAGSGWPWR